MKHNPSSPSLSVLTLALMISMCAVIASACANTESAECNTRDDCPANEVCTDESCVAPSTDGQCASDDECPRGFSCVTRLCVESSTGTTGSTNNGTTGDTGSTGTGTSGTTGTTGSTNNGTTGSTNNGTTGTTGSTNNGTTGTTGTSGTTGTTGVDREPPVVLSTVPEAGANNVPITATINITFSEPIDGFGLDQKIILQNADNLGDPIPIEVEHNADQVTITPFEPLLPGTPYQVTITNQIIDASPNRNPIPDSYRWIFATGSVPDAEQDALALRFAPVIYQEVATNPGDARSDYFTTIDFDGDWDVSNNIDTFRTSPLPSTAYYSIIETTSHIFIQYLFYYPSYRDGGLIPHDVSAVQVVLTQGENPQFVMAESGTGPQYFGFALEGSGVSARNLGELALTFPQTAMWNETHYPAYNGRPEHGSCHWLWAPGTTVLTSAPWCRHEANEFNNDDLSIVYYPSSNAQTFEDANCAEQNACAADVGLACAEDSICRDADGRRAITYNVENIFDNLWLRRISIDGETNVFAGRRSYNPHPDSGDRPGSADSFSFPSALAGGTGESRASLPFVWDSQGSINGGQWWLDPAWTFRQRFTFGENNDNFSLDYCYNPYFNIDLRGTSPECP